MAANTYERILTKGPESALPSIFTDGVLRFTTDTGRMFVDNQSGRVEVTDFVKGMTEAEIKALLAPLVSKIYISSDTDKMMYYDTTSGWTEINSAEADYAASAGTATYANTAGEVAYVAITYQQWQNMTPQERAAHDYFIADYPDAGIVANQIPYDNTVSGLESTEVQGAIDELSSEKKDEYTTITYAQWQQLTPTQKVEKDYYISDYPTTPIDAGNISYSNTTSGLDATNVQGAVDELASEKKDEYTTITYAQWQALTPAQQSAKDYYISDYPSSAITAGNVSYSNTTSGMSANNVQGAVDELKSGLNNLVRAQWQSNVTTNQYGIIETTIPKDYGVLGARFNDKLCIPFTRPSGQYWSVVICDVDADGKLVIVPNSTANLGVNYIAQTAVIDS